MCREGRRALDRAWVVNCCCTLPQPPHCFSPDLPHPLAHAGSASCGVPSSPCASDMAAHSATTIHVALYLSLIVEMPVGCCSQFDHECCESHVCTGCQSLPLGAHAHLLACLVMQPIRLASELEPRVLTHGAGQPSAAACLTFADLAGLHGRAANDFDSRRRDCSAAGPPGPPGCCLFSLYWAVPPPQQVRRGHHRGLGRARTRQDRGCRMLALMLLQVQPRKPMCPLMQSSMRYYADAWLDAHMCPTLSYTHPLTHPVSSLDHSMQ
jgi:hypothetical protein